MKLYTLDQIKEAVKLEQLLEPTRQAYIQFSKGEAQSSIGVLYPAPKTDVHIKAAVLKNHPYFVVKIANWSGSNQAKGQNPSSGFVAVFEAESGEGVALLQDEGYLSDLRTAAAGAVATDALAPKQLSRAGIVGTGLQASMQAKALLLVRRIDVLYLWGRDKLKVKKLAQRLQDKLDIQVSATELEVLVEQSEVIISATSSPEPLIKAQWLSQQHITAVGADDTHKQELEVGVLEKATTLVVDSREANSKYGEVYQAHQKGIHLEMLELGEVLAHPTFKRPSGVSVAKLVGLGVQDLVAAETVLKALHH
jgi:ornithine cyclodeaminase/alanine dehydrogenase-like protein (mu-crystallin family)